MPRVTMTTTPHAKTKTAAEDQCPKCGKEPALCLCATINSVKNEFVVVILQHPQEPDKTLGSARLSHTILQKSILKVGLSWPNLAAVLDRPKANNMNWGVLYLGGKNETPRGKPARIRILDARGQSWEADDSGLEGIIVLDGTWSQAKTLWWRNPWLVKCKRIILTPQHKSMYGELRKEPRREALSTIESIAETLEALGDNSGAPDKLRSAFGELLRRCRDLGANTDLAHEELDDSEDSSSDQGTRK